MQISSNKSVIGLMFAASLILLGISSLTYAAILDSLKTWSGQVPNVKLENDWPNATPITNKKDFEKVWKSWVGKKDIPDIDFSKDFLLVLTSRKGQPAMVQVIEQGGGNAVSFSTIDSTKVPKGFAYAFSQFKRGDIKRLNGEPLKK